MNADCEHQPWQTLLALTSRVMGNGSLTEPQEGGSLAEPTWQNLPGRTYLAEPTWAGAAQTRLPLAGTQMGEPALRLRVRVGDHVRSRGPAGGQGGRRSCGR